MDEKDDQDNQIELGRVVKPTGMEDFWQTISLRCWKEFNNQLPKQLQSHQAKQTPKSNATI